MVVRGVPRRLARDGWWLDDAPPRRVAPVWLLLAVVICADLLVWGVAAGLGFVVCLLLVTAAVHLAVGQAVPLWRAMAAWGLLIVSLLPAVDLVQPLSVGFAVLGMLAFSACMIVPDWDASALFRTALRLPGAGLVQTFRDAKNAKPSMPSKVAVGRVLTDWLVPLAVGGVFICLLALANPVVDAWLIRLGALETGFSVDAGRVAFWGAVALIAWPLLRLAVMKGTLNRPSRRIALPQSRLINGRSVLRALVLFNLIFAVQSLLDMGYLWGGVRLPAGMSYAEYAHRGAYPLLVAALLAGFFALISQPFAGDRPVLRILLYIWIGQTVLLVLSSILRLDLYVEAYGLTRLRFAAFIWMVLVALGLVLMIMQMMAKRSAGWFIARAAGLGLLALYTVSLVNVDGFIARHNLAVGKVDGYYLCGLSEGAAPALAAYGPPLCQRAVSVPQDWRAWGFRNARLRRSVAQMEEVQG
ncbi:DUF4173 domain-containing protein [Cognatiyoonia sp. IB215446]|uniref:DUF4153 domain-containing protein n=1 Tax=Cognatiyoonia sp. IB215446 TaxID=3097355 RepID=UPI002A0E9BFF|nr:DUF4173 domain-containing protein [Cognatiyoonia sp. IB215446]MDX8346811.1 DUF4173 domain-containing protein [Cognatiyoonia sp. IB215446]